VVRFLVASKRVSGSDDARFLRDILRDCLRDGLPMRCGVFCEIFCEIGVRSLWSFIGEIRPHGGVGFKGCVAPSGTWHGWHSDDGCVLMM
jgi:hypothetical protein